MLSEQVEEYLKAIYNIAGKNGTARKQRMHDRSIVPITDLAPREKGVIKFLKGDHKVVQRLSDLGLTLHTEVELLRKAPMNGPIEICVRRTNLAIAREIADNIFVNAAG